MKGYEKALKYLIGVILAIALGVGLFLITNLQRTEEFIASTDIESIRARNAYDPAAADELTDEAELMRIAQHFNELALVKTKSAPDESEGGMVSVEFSYKNGAKTTVYQLGERFLRVDNGPWLEIAGESSEKLEDLLDSARYVSLRQRFPEYFDLSLGQGLDVFAWKLNGEFVYGIAPMASLYEAGEYPTSLAPMSAEELLFVLGTYSSDEVSALISNVCMAENDEKRFSYYLANDSIFFASSSYFTPSVTIVTDGDYGFSWSSYISNSIWLGSGSVANDPTATERNCIRLLPLIAYSSDAARSDYSYLGSLFEREIAPMFKKYEISIPD